MHVDKTWALLGLSSSPACSPGAGRGSEIQIQSPFPFPSPKTHTLTRMHLNAIPLSRPVLFDHVLNCKGKQWKASVNGELWHIFCYIQPWIPAGVHYCLCVHPPEEGMVLLGEGKTECGWRYCRGKVMHHELSQIQFHGGPIPQSKTGC